MHQIDPIDHLRILAQERDAHIERARLSRVAAVRADLARHERRVDEALRELVRALEDVGGARRALVAIESG